MVAIVLLAKKLQNRRVVVYCDNESVVHMVNKSSTICTNCMILIRIITLTSLRYNVRFFLNHIRGKNNKLADLLSRGKFQQFITTESHDVVLFITQTCPAPGKELNWFLQGAAVALSRLTDQSQLLSTRRLVPVGLSRLQCMYNRMQGNTWWVYTVL